MDRGELRAIIRRMMTAEQSVMISDIELNAIINDGLIDLAKELGGEVTNTTLTTDAEGFVDLPTDCLLIHRIEYGGKRIGRVAFEEIQELEETS